MFDDYADAIYKSNAYIAYISSTNHSHFEWAEAALNAGFHTIVDKPATVSLADTEELICIAQRQKLLLSESIVYTYHPQLNLINSLFEKGTFLSKIIDFFFFLSLLWIR